MELLGLILCITIIPIGIYSIIAKITAHNTLSWIIGAIIKLSGIGGLLLSIIYILKYYHII